MLKKMIPILCLSLAVVACENPAPSPTLDVEAVLKANNIEGPDVDSVRDTWKKNAEKAYREKNFPRAAQFYHQLLSQEKDNPDYLYAYAESARRSGKYDVALATYEYLLSLQPEHLDALEGRGLTLMAAEEYDEAGKVLTQVIARDRTRWRSLNAAGILFTIKGRSKDAMAYYNSAIKAGARKPSVLNNIALTLSMDKKYDKATRALERAVSLVPEGSMEHKQLELNLALIYGIKGNMDAAQQIASRHLSGAQLYNNLGYYAYLHNDEDLARSYLNMALTKSPRHYGKAWKNLQRVQKNHP